MQPSGQAAGYRAYRRVQTETSSPGELVVMLYDALAADLQRPEAGLQKRERHEEAHVALVRAQEIVLELIASLNAEAGELAQQLDDVYQYVYGRLVDANVKKDADAVREAARLVAPIRQAFIAAVRQVGSPANAPPAPSTEV